MASISDTGIAFALPTAALAASSLAAAAPIPQPPITDIRVEIAGLRDGRGLVHLCLTRDPTAFPDCKGPGATHATIKAEMAVLHYEFRSVPAGTYAITVFHDANADGKLNTMLGIPTEGFAFSRNPAMHARAPRFNEASFPSNGPPLERLRMKYLF
jgi:uncharacterized protein (DUF2141 family)